MRYYIVGYMYSGKSTFGRRLAEARGMEFIDLDRAFEERYHYTVLRFFEVFGEASFRTLEKKMLRETGEREGVVVATGGGTPCFSDNMDFILSRGTAVYLKMEQEEILRRSLRSRNPRPLLHGMDEEQRRAFIGKQLKEREVFYGKAQVVLKNEEDMAKYIVGEE